MERICKNCSTSLDMEIDSIGVGCRYWRFGCPKCSKKFIYDAYKLILEEWPEEEKLHVIEQNNKTNRFIEIIREL